MLFFGFFSFLLPGPEINKFRTLLSALKVNKLIMFFFLNRTVYFAVFVCFFLVFVVHSVSARLQ